jgi:hypothetical protein
VKLQVRFTQISSRDALIESVVGDQPRFQMGNDLNNGGNEWLFDGCFDRIADGVTTIDRKVTGMSSVLWQMTIRFIGSVSR